MSRIASVWLKGWPIARLLQSQKASGARDEFIDQKHPFVLTAPGKGGVRVAVLNDAAHKSGIVVGELLSNARSKIPKLQHRNSDPVADDAALRRLALWCLRYTPIVTPWDAENGADGLFLNITGCAQLFGGEASLLEDIANRLDRFGLSPRIAIADTVGAAWGISRYGATDRMIVPSGKQQSTLQDLPLAALRLPEPTRAVLRRLGFKRIGEVLKQPRAPLALRFGSQLLLRLDQAIGRASEPLTPFVQPPVYRVGATFIEPITTEAHVVEAARRLLCKVVEKLTNDCVGARQICLLLFRLNGEILPLEVGLTAPSRDVEHMAALISVRLDRLPSGLEADFGFEAAALHVRVAEPISERQDLLEAEQKKTALDGLAQLLDKLEQRLGAGAVRRLYPRQSHIPERAVSAGHATEAPASDWATFDDLTGVRPLFLLSRPEAAHVTALAPEGPPRQFRWRGVLHQVAGMQGPERIAPEWWRRAADDFERDYYIVEDQDGRRFWLYRAMHRNRSSTSPPWFVHGVFA